MSIYLGNLAYKITEKDLEDAFDVFSEITSTTVVRDRQGRSKGYAFIALGSPEAEREAIEKLNGQQLLGRQLVVRSANREEPYPEVNEDNRGNVMEDVTRPPRDSVHLSQKRFVPREGNHVRKVGRTPFKPRNQEQPTDYPREYRPSH